MATKVFISVCFSDGQKIKDELVELFDESTEAVSYRKNRLGNYDDWLYDELRYSL